MTVKQVMTTEVHFLDRNASILDAAELMKAANVGLLPIFDHRKIVGVVTDRDLVLRCLAGDYPAAAPVREIMTPQPLVLDENIAVDEALERMAERRVGRAIVLDGEGKLSGVLAALDAAAACNGYRSLGHLMNALKRAHKSRAKHAVAEVI